MDSLPPEIKLNIFNLLSIRESIKCRQVCKDWLSIVDCLRYKSLDFEVSEYERSEIKKKYKKTIELWILNVDKFVRSVTIDPKFSRIKVMKGLFLNEEVKNLDVFINHFHELEELYLNNAPKLVNFVLNLKFLKKVELNFSSSKVKLETPSLTHLMTEQFSNIEICYPEKIKYIEMEVGDFDEMESLTKFKNLEILILQLFEDSDSSHLSADILNRLPQLKRVYVGYKLGNLIKRLDQIPIGSNSELQVYYYGFRINSDLFGNFDWTNIKNSKEAGGNEWASFMARNYLTSIDDNPYTFNLNCTLLLDEFDQNVLNDFFKKITKLELAIVDKLDDEMQILILLKSSKPRCVFIENPTLSRLFLEQLSKFSFINFLHLSIDEWPFFFDDFNFDFKNKEISLKFQIRCSLKSLRSVFEVFERARLIEFRLDIYRDEFRLFLDNSHVFRNTYADLRIFFEYTPLNGGYISTWCEMESLDFGFYLDSQVPSIVESKDKLRLFFMIKEYVTQRSITKKIISKLYWNPTISIKF